ncbi:MAG: hypothetical protein ABI377_07455 [Devosia sp.]
MPDTHTVDVAIPVDARVAAALDDVMMRALAGRMVSHMLEAPSVERLFEVIDTMKAEAHSRGLTDEILDAELAAYNAERRDAPPAA